MHHADYMREALAEAREAGRLGEVPVGAIVVHEGRIVARAGNRRETRRDPLGHAELDALQLAARDLQRWRLTGCTLYVTLEPCPMCAAAAIQARIDTIVFGAMDPRLGACGTALNLTGAPEWNHHPAIIGGVAEEACAALLRDFFSARRD